MKKIKIVITRQALPVFLFGIIGLMANAQKLPNTQTTSLRAPANIKVDGKSTEWNNQFQAYNHATEIFYTIANDDKNLYLIVKATDPTVINYKILRGGLTFAIQLPGKNDVSFTYPITNDNKFLSFPLRLRKGVAPDTLVKTADSIMNIHNKILDQRCKYIVVDRIKGLDTISVYNGDGIKAAGRFDNKKTYTIELSVELKVLGLSASDVENFKYHITLNGSKSIQHSTPITPAGADERLQQMMAQVQFIESTMFAPTDFWGEYTLAQK